MRILHISTRLILGGSQENTVLSCEAQAARGHEVHLAFGPIYGPEGSLRSRVEAFNARGGRIGVHVVPHLMREVRPITDWRAERELRGLVAALRPDIVHTHSSKAGILGRRAAWGAFATRERPGVVHTVHGPPFMPVEGGVLRRSRIRVVNAAYVLAERHAAHRCHAIVSVADAMTEQFLARGIGRREQFETVRSGMEVERYLTPGAGESREAMRAGLGIGPGDFVVGTVARLAEHKGHDDLLEALGDDLVRHPEWRLLWIGDGWWRGRLVARARGMGLGVAELDRGEKADAAKVLITGLVPSERVPAMMRAMDVLAHPSYREGLPRTVPQALLCGVFPVAYDVDGTREVCVEGETGRLVPLGDRAKLREAIAWCFAHPEERSAMVARGRERCALEFSVEAMADGLERVYARALRLARGG